MKHPDWARVDEEDTRTDEMSIGGRAVEDARADRAVMLLLCTSCSAVEATGNKWLSGLQGFFFVAGSTCADASEDIYLLENPFPGFNVCTDSSFEDKASLFCERRFTRLAYGTSLRGGTRSATVVRTNEGMCSGLGMIGMGERHRQPRAQQEFLRRGPFVGPGRYL